MPPDRRADIDEAIAAIKAYTPPADYQLLLDYFGHCIAANKLARSYNVSRSRVSQIANATRKRLRIFSQDSFAVL